MKKNRYVIFQNEIEIGETSSIAKVSQVIGCSAAHVYINKRDTSTGFTLIHKKKVYTITDRYMVFLNETVNN